VSDIVINFVTQRSFGVVTTLCQQEKNYLILCFIDGIISGVKKAFSIMRRLVIQHKTYTKIFTYLK